MDGLGWDENRVLANTSLWNNQQNGVLGLTEDIFGDIQALQNSQILLQLNSSSARHQEAARLVENEMLVKSGSGVTWGEAQELYSTTWTDKRYSTTPMATDLGMNEQSTIINGLPAGGKPLDCLLSATTSNNDTSVEDDEISVIFSDCRNPWNLGAGTAVVSSGESAENNTCNARKKELCFPASEFDETVSQSSSDQFENSMKSSKCKAVSTKRSYDQSELMVDGEHPYSELLKAERSSKESSFRLTSETPPISKKPRRDKRPSTSNISFQQPSSSVSSCIEEPADPEAIAQMKEMIYRSAVFRPINIGLELAQKPKRKNVRISTDPQTVAARQRRERISERLRLLQSLVPGGSKMDTASLLDEAANYLKFLKSQVKTLENHGHKFDQLVNCSPPLNHVFFSSFPFNQPFLIQNPSHIHQP